MATIFTKYLYDNNKRQKYNLSDEFFWFYLFIYILININIQTMNF